MKQGYSPQKITAELIRRVSKWPPPDRPREILDSTHQLVLRHQPSGYLSLYALLGRGKRERVCNARDIIDTDKSITITTAKNQARVLRGEGAAGVDHSAVRKAEREIPRFGDFLGSVYGPWLVDNPDHRDAGGTLARLDKAFRKDFGKDKLDAIMPRRLDTWKARRLKGGAKPETVNRDLNALKSCFSTFANWNSKFDNPLRGYRGIKVDAKRKIVRAFEDGEVAKLLKACAARDELKRTERASANKWRDGRGYKLLPPLDGIYPDCLTPAVIVSIETGLRRRELFELRWPFVNLKTKTLQVEPETAKDYETRVVPLTDAAVKVLREWWMQQGQPKRGRVFPVNNLKKSFYGVIEDAGIERIGADGKRLNWHSLRHTFGSRLGAAGVDPETIRDLMGHADLKTTQRYLHSSEDRKRKAVAKL